LPLSAARKEFAARAARNYAARELDGGS